MAVAGFNQLLQTMASMDFFTGVLPFVLTYVILYAALDRVPVIEDQDNFPALIAIIGAFFVARFIVLNPWYQQFFITFFGKLTVGLIGFIGLMVLLAFTGYNLKEKGGMKSPLVVMIMVAVAGAAFTSAGGFGPPLISLQSLNLGSIFSYLLESGLIWIIVVGGALMWVSSDSENGGNSNPLRPFFSNKFWTEQMDDDG